MDRNYHRVHSWLIYNYGRASKCEFGNCKHPNPKRFEWALIKGKKYEKRVNNFIQLCPSCHRKYDITDEIRLKMSLNSANKGKKSPMARPVILNGKFEYESITIASEKTGVSRGSIHNNLKGLSEKTRLGIWTYKS